MGLTALSRRHALLLLAVLVAVLVALVASPQLLRELPDLETVSLEMSPARAHGRIGHEPDLDLRVRDDHDTDVAALDHRVARAAELPLTRAHDLAHLRVAGDDRDGAEGRREARSPQACCGDSCS